MRTVVIGVVLAGLAGVALAEPPAYSSAEGKYSIKFPDLPRVTTPTAKTVVGDLKVTVATYAFSDGNTLMVSFTDFPAAATKPENHATLLDGIRDGIKGRSGSVTDERARTFGAEKFPGREFMVEKGKQRIKFRVLVRENRVYQIAAIGTPEFVGGKEATAFLDSFELSK